MFPIIIVGQGKMALDCAKLASECPGAALAAVVSTEVSANADRRMRAFCRKRSIPVPGPDPNAPSVVEALQRLEAAFLLSVNNYRILKGPILAAVSVAALNFHNGPLPRYAGVHIPSWAIWNGERRHGVTWHYIDAGIDTGDIAAQALFDLTGEETAAELTLRCILEGTALFTPLLRSLIAGSPARRPQLGERSYFGAQEIPNGGYLDLAWPASTLERFLRAMSFKPFPRPFGRLKLGLRGGDWLFEDAELGPAENARRAGVEPGTVLAVDAATVTVRTADRELTLQGVVHAAGERSVSDALRVGDRLPTM